MNKSEIKKMYNDALDELQRDCVKIAELQAENERLKYQLDYIANEFMTPSEIRQNDIGLTYEEQLEMAYENMQEVARLALKEGIKNDIHNDCN